jgi:hypothetical protein
MIFSVLEGRSFWISPEVEEHLRESAKRTAREWKKRTRQRNLLRRLGFSEESIQRITQKRSETSMSRRDMARIVDHIVRKRRD